MKKQLVFLPLLIFIFLMNFPIGCTLEKEMKERTFEKKIPDIVDFNFHVKPILSDRCFKCHGPDPNVREAGLRFDTKDGAFAALGEDLDHYAIIPGDVQNSTIVDRIYTQNEDDVMPPVDSNLKLDEYEKEVLKKWIEQGADWKKHWSFIPLIKPELPKVVNSEWPQNEIDYFVLAKLEKENIPPSETATKEQLIRRLSFDLTGLPPSIEILDQYLTDDSEKAFEKIVDTYLGTDAYAEKMTTYWLDLARYADTHGYQDDLERIMFPWRDWVIHAYQDNMPYDQFVKWQLAGDLMPEASREQIIATAFNRNHKITQEGGVIPEEYRVEYVSDRTQTFGTAFLGLTVECAKCHDHKYDPISQKDYYSLFAFFNNVPEQGLIEPYGAIPEPYIKISNDEIKKTLHFINNMDTMEEIPLLVMEEMKEPRQAYILSRGAYDKRTEPVDPETPESILPFEEKWPKNRLGLAEWLFDPRNPLTPRVTVNRLWQQCFGSGIVATSNDFGNQGALPTHPELLDWLAVKIQEESWDLKAMLKYIVMSSTYQQSTKVNEALLERDPENLLLARAPRLRLSAEMIRDQALMTSGLLNQTIGGPSVKPYQPPGLWQETTGGGGGSTSTYIPDSGSKLYRRSIYTFWKRTVPPPSMMTFDAASRDLCMVERQSTSTPLQALVMMNDPQIVEASRVLAFEVVAEKQVLRERIALMFRKITSRQVSEDELDQLANYFEVENLRFMENPESATALLAIGEFENEGLLEEHEMAAYTLVANTIFNLDESISRG